MDFCGVRFLLCCCQGRGYLVVAGAPLGRGKVEQIPEPGRAVEEAIQSPFPYLAHQKDTLQKPG